MNTYLMLKEMIEHILHKPFLAASLKHHNDNI